VTWSGEPTTAAEYLAAHGRREQDRRPPAAVVARGRAHVRGTVPAWVAPAPADVTAAHRVAAGWYRDEPARRWEGGFAATLGWLLDPAVPAPVTRRRVRADQGTVLAEAGAADVVLYRTSRASVLAAVMCGTEHGAPMVSVTTGGVTSRVPDPVVEDQEWAAGVLAACMWLLNLTADCPLLLPTRPAPTVKQLYDALRRDPASVGASPRALWATAAAQAEVNRMATAYADGVPAERRRTVPPMPAGLT
jgi:hypothetical protein